MSELADKPARQAPDPVREHEPKRAADATPEGGSPRGFAALHAHQRAYFGTVAYRFTEGRHGTPPLAGYHEQRTAPVREFVARQAHGPAGAGKVPGGSGAALASGVEARLAPILGSGIAQARIHTGNESAAAAKDFGARAFTVGNDVHFGAGEYQPGTKEGDRLLAHELTHVVQGQSSGLQRKAAEPESSDGKKETGANGSDGAGEAPEVSQPGDPAEQEADRVGDAAAESLHGADGAAKASAAEQGAGSRATSAGAEKKAQAPTISAKLDGVGRKIFRSAAPPSAPSAAPGAAPDAEVELSAAKSELAAEASKSGSTYTAEEADALAMSLAPGGKVKRSVLESKKPGCETALKREWRTKLANDRAFVGAVAKPDPIAQRKFGELDGEPDTNYEGGGGAARKVAFYRQLATVLESNAVPRMNVFGKCGDAVRDAGLRMLGKIIPESVLEPTLHRTAGIENTWKYSTDQKGVAEHFASRAAPPQHKGKAGEQILAEDPNAVKQHWISMGGAAQQFLKGVLTPPSGGTWFSSGSVSVKPGDAGFAQLMEVGALQPEWFADGAVKFTISSAGLGNVRENLRKPTCLDGMQSAMFVPKYDLSWFGVTGGGYNEFLAGVVPVSNVVQMQIISTSQTLSQAIKDANGEAGKSGHSSAMDAMERGQKLNLGQAQGVYNQVGQRTEQERKNPTQLDGLGQRPV